MCVETKGMWKTLRNLTLNAPSSRSFDDVKQTSCPRAFKTQ